MRLSNEQLSDLYDRHSEEIFRFARGEVGDSQAAIDLVGETFAQAVRGRSKFRGTTLDDARPWLFGIARRLILRYHRRGFVERKTMARLKLEQVVIQSNFEGADFAATEVAELVNASLADLRPEYREAIELRFLNEKSYSEMAESLGVSEDVARARVSRGLKRLRKSANDREDREMIRK